MADVRLTATNPEDSSVVPVACDASGRLLLEEPVQGPAGEQGPPGPQGDPGQDGDPFSGNFAGDVNFDSSATFANTVDIGTVQIDHRGTVLVAADDTRAAYFGCFKNIVSGGNEVYRITRDGDTYLGNIGGGELPDRAKITMQARVGSASFAGRITQGPAWDRSVSQNQGMIDNGTLHAKRVNLGDPIIRGYRGANLGDNNDLTVEIKADGSAVFAGNKAGFTAEGYLWCTTRRGDTVILDFTSNGTGQWVEFTPTTRIEEIRDKLDANRGDMGEIPTDTP
jgi:hypothetical protein